MEADPEADDVQLLSRRGDRGATLLKLMQRPRSRCPGQAFETPRGGDPPRLAMTKRITDLGGVRAGGRRISASNRPRDRVPKTYECSSAHRRRRGAPTAATSRMPPHHTSTPRRARSCTTSPDEKCTSRGWRTSPRDGHPDGQSVSMPCSRYREVDRRVFDGSEAKEREGLRPLGLRRSRGVARPSLGSTRDRRARARVAPKTRHPWRDRLSTSVC
jgi:hypothetical protein